MNWDRVVQLTEQLLTSLGHWLVSVLPTLIQWTPATGSFGLGILCIGIFPGFDGFLLGLMLIGCCSATMFPLMINLISRHFPSEKLGIAAGSYETVFSLGSAIGPILAGSLALFAGVRWAFALFSLFGAVMFLFVIVGKSRQS